METTIETFPTVVVGLGGSGQITLNHLKALIKDRLGTEETPLLKLLAIDLAQKNSSYLQAGEFLRLETQGLGCLIRNRRYPWIPDPDRFPILRKIASSDAFLERGASGIRVAGRVALVANRTRVRKALRDKATMVMDRAARLRAKNASLSPTLRVWIVSSVAGGTGAGCLFDVAAMVKNLQYRVHTTGLLFLPDCFAQKSDIPEGVLERCKATGYATLRELVYLLEGREFIADYESETFNAYGLFDEIWLVDGLSETGIALDGDREEPWKMAAEFLYSSLFTDLGERLDSQTQEGHLLTGGTASFGIHRITHPVKKLGELVKLRKILGAFEELMNAANVEKSHEPPSPGRLDEIGLKILPSELIPQRRPSELARSVERKCAILKRWAEESPREELLKLAQKNAKELLPELSENLREKVKVILGAHGIGAATAFLRAEEEVLRKAMEKLSRELPRLDNEIKTSRETILEEIEELSKGFINKKFRFNRRIGGLIDACNTLLEKEADYVRDVVLIDVVADALLKELAQLNLELEDLKNRISIAITQIKTKIERLEGELNATGVFEENIGSEDDVRAYYADLQPNLKPKLPYWIKLKDPEQMIQEGLLEFKAADEAAEGHLYFDKHPEEIRQRLARADALASPYFRPSEPYEQDSSPLYTFVLTGYPGEADLSSAIAEGIPWHRSTSLDKNEIIMVKVRLGISPKNLKPLDEYRRQSENFQKHYPLYILDPEKLEPL
jgi:hypothetical protein